MTPDFIQKLTEQLKRDEGCRLEAYKDSLGYWTIGYGHKLSCTMPPITQEQADEWLVEDIAHAKKQLDNVLPWAENLSQVRYAVLLNMTFNLGIYGLAKFHRMIFALKDGSALIAAQEMRDSLWHKQVGPRAKRLEAQLITEQWQ